MAAPKSSFFSLSSWLRVIADTALIQAAVIISLVLRYVFIYVFEEDASGLRETAAWYFMLWLKYSPLLTIISLMAMWVSGVYTKRRLYLGRFKVLAVLQSISIAFLIYVALRRCFFVQEIIVAGELKIDDFPRWVLLWSCGLSVALLVGARTFIRVWHRYGDHEPTNLRFARDEGDRRVLVVGGAGYIGSALVPQLLESGHQVRVLDAMLFGDEALSRVKDHKRLEIMQGDFRSGCLGTAMRNVGSVVHLAGIVGDPACNIDESLTIDVNLTSTRAIADMAKWIGVRRFIFASTCSVYGACDEMLDEKSVAKPVSLYGNTKLASERVLLEMADEHFSPTILRFATIYGFSGRTRFDLVVNLLSAKAKVDGKITIFNGRQWRPFVHVQDAAMAIKLVAEAPTDVVHNEIFNVGSKDQNYTISQVGEMIHKKVIGSEIVVDDSGTDSRNYRVDFTKIREYLGFEPKWTVDQGIEQVLDAIATGQVSDYRDPKHSNYAFLNLQGTTELARDHWAVELIRDLEGV